MSPVSDVVLLPSDEPTFCRTRDTTHLHDGAAVAEAQPRALRQVEDVQAAHGDVLAQLARQHLVPRPLELVEQLLRHQVDLQRSAATWRSACLHEVAAAVLPLT